MLLRVRKLMFSVPEKRRDIKPASTSNCVAISSWVMPSSCRNENPGQHGIAATGAKSNDAA